MITGPNNIMETVLSPEEDVRKAFVTIEGDKVTMSTGVFAMIIEDHAWLSGCASGMRDMIDLVKSYERVLGFAEGTTKISERIGEEIVKSHNSQTGTISEDSE